jgi:hypothetical protein
MAVNRYDQRKNYEEAEANAVGTAYVRTDLLPAADAAAVRALPRSYRPSHRRTQDSQQANRDRLISS